MERLIRYGKKVTLAILMTFVVVFTGIFSTSFNSSAANEMDHGQEFNVNYAEPSTSDNQGYICLYVVNSSGVYGVVTYFWNTIASASGYDSPSYAYITLSSSSIKFQIAGSSGASGYYSLTQIGMTGNWWNVKNSSTEPFEYDFASAGMTVLGYHYKGNVGSISGMTMSTNPFTVYFNSDASATLLRDLWDLVYGIWQLDWSILDALNNIGASVDGVENQLASCISYLQSVDSELDSIKSELQKIYSKADEILSEEKKQTNFLEWIWYSIEKFFNPSDEDKQKEDDYNAESELQKNEIDDLNEQNQTEKVDVDTAVSDVDANINYDDMAQYGGVLATITNNEYILQLILVVVSIAIISYVLFGKR